MKSLLNLAGELINQFGEAPELSLSCESIAGCDKTTGAEAWPIHLYPNGWQTQIELMTSEPQFLDHLFASGIGKEPGYEIRCLVGGVTQSDFCEGLTSAKLENIWAEKDVLEVFNPEAPISSQRGSCELGGTGAGELLDEYLFFLESGLDLAVSTGPIWLVDGNPITEVEGPLATQIEGLLELIDTKTPIVVDAGVDCEVILDGTVGSEGRDEITEVLNLAKELISTLGGLALKCDQTSPKLGCEGTDPEVWPTNLPWLTELESMTSEPEFLDHLFAVGAGKEPGWELKCLIAGLSVEDLCEGLTSAKMENVAEGDVLALFNPEAPTGSEKESCTQGGEASGVIVSEVLVLLTSGKELLVSLP